MTIYTTFPLLNVTWLSIYWVSFNQINISMVRVWSLFQGDEWNVYTCIFRDLDPWRALAHPNFDCSERPLDGRRLVFETRFRKGKFSSEMEFEGLGLEHHSGGPISQYTLFHVNYRSFGILDCDTV